MMQARAGVVMGAGGFFNPSFFFLLRFLYFYFMEKHVYAKRLGLEKLGR